MAVFDSITFTWKGQDYVVPPERVLRTIAAVESVMTIGQIGAAFKSSAPPLAQLAQAFGTALRLAGASVTDDEIYEHWFSEGGPASVRLAMDALSVLSAMMLPPAYLKLSAGKVGAGAEAEKKPSGLPKKRTR